MNTPDVTSSVTDEATPKPDTSPPSYFEQQNTLIFEHPTKQHMQLVLPGFEDLVKPKIVGDCE